VTPAAQRVPDLLTPQAHSGIALPGKRADSPPIFYDSKTGTDYLSLHCLYRKTLTTKTNQKLIYLTSHFYFLRFHIKIKLLFFDVN
jgi:hypothetical protein